MGRKQSRLYIVDLKNGTINEVKEIADDIAVGDAVWTPDGSGLLFSGFPIPDRRLGLIYWYAGNIDLQLSFLKTHSRGYLGQMHGCRIYALFCIHSKRLQSMHTARCDLSRSHIAR